jgi:proline utilization trans-activator
MHREGPNAEFDPIERNTRRQVWWSIYIFEKILSNILGRPTVIDETEMSIRVPDTLLLDQKTMSGEFMTYSYRIVRLSVRIRQQAYFDPVTAEERTPTVECAESLLRECDQYLISLSPEMSIVFPLAPSENRGTVLLHHIFYYYMRCIVSREFHIQKVERDISHFENQTPNISENWGKVLALSEDCVESAHKSLQCTMAGAHLGIIGFSWLNLFFVFHSILIVCADFLARPKDRHESHKDSERKAMVHLMLNHIRGLKLPPTYTILNKISLQFASITGVSERQPVSRDGSTQSNDLSQEPVSMSRSEGISSALADVTGLGEDWFSSAATTLGLDFFDFDQLPDTSSAYDDYATYSAYSMGDG